MVERLRKKVARKSLIVDFVFTDEEKWRVVKEFFDERKKILGSEEEILFELLGVGE